MQPLIVSLEKWGKLSWIISIGFKCEIGLLPPELYVNITAPNCDLVADFGTYVSVDDRLFEEEIRIVDLDVDEVCLIIHWLLWTL